MSEAELSGEAEPNDFTPTSDGQEGSEGPSIEERASMSGWREGGDLSAEEFLAKRDDHLGLARSNNERLENELHSLRKETETMAKMQKAFMDKSRQQGYEAAMAEVKAKKSEAIANADPDSFAEAEREEQELKDEQAKTEQDEATQHQRAQMAELVGNFRDKYPEAFETRQRANAWAEEVKYQTQVIGLSVEDAMTKAVSAVAEQFNFKQKSSSSLESGKGGGEGNKSFADLPADAKQAYKKFADQGLFEGEAGKKEYAEEYWKQS